MESLAVRVDPPSAGGRCEADAHAAFAGEDSARRDAAAARLAVPDQLYALDRLDVLYEPRGRVLWTFMRHVGRPSFTPELLADFEAWQRLIRQGFGHGGAQLDFLVLGSRSPGVFCLGGDLELFRRLIRAGDRQGLIHYGVRCVEILHRNLNALELPVVTVALVQGQALGGGFEAMLSFDHVVAERSATFGLPEVMFGLFPGMGAHAILARKLGTAAAERIILSNQTYTAEQMHALGIVHQLAEDGEGAAAVHDYIARSARRHAGLCGAYRAMRECSPVPLGELKRIVEHWADSALCLRDQDLRTMHRLASAQNRLAAAQ